MRTAVALLFLLLIAAAPTSQPHQKSIHIKEGAPDSVRAYVEASIAVREQRLSVLKHEAEEIQRDIDDMKRGRIVRQADRSVSRTPRKNGNGSNYVFGSSDIKRNAILARMDELKDKKSDIEKYSDPAFMPDIFCGINDLRPGFMGRMDNLSRVKVAEICDTRNVIVNINKGRPTFDSVDMWIAEYSTDHLSEGMEIHPPGIWIFSTIQPQVPGYGGRTILMATPIPLSQYVEIR